MDMIGSILGGAQAGGAGAPTSAKPATPVGEANTAAAAKPLDPNAPGQSGFGQRAVRGMAAGSAAVQKMEHPAWAVIDRMAGGSSPEDRMGFAQNNPQAMNMLKGLFD